MTYLADHLGGRAKESAGPTKFCDGNEVSTTRYRVVVLTSSRH